MSSQSLSTPNGMSDVKQTLAWCQQLKLSTKEQKLEAYRRLCEHAYPNQKNSPATAKEANIQTWLQYK
ncbi:PREDICTED: developmental pluripotency-associated protein 4-like [Chrysochloris asiatica]|uniref:Developmental pluripotency-associated protein 4-like n=1 Tax=Chrysochloris asiatica TaxID=185453 RepID=A0A9B0X2U8_CHRAS|nr:PREDICTED: developmental pluripotency-associated protein 4-like [Chrysochloris asiatica]